MGGISMFNSQLLIYSKFQKAAYEFAFESLVFGVCLAICLRAG